MYICSVYTIELSVLAASMPTLRMLIGRATAVNALRKVDRLEQDAFRGAEVRVALELEQLLQELEALLLADPLDVPVVALEVVQLVLRADQLVLGQNVLGGAAAVQIHAVVVLARHILEIEAAVLGGAVCAAQHLPVEQALVHLPDAPLRLEWRGIRDVRARSEFGRLGVGALVDNDLLDRAELSKELVAAQNRLLGQPLRDPDYVHQCLLDHPDVEIINVGRALRIITHAPHKIRAIIRSSWEIFAKVL